MILRTQQEIMSSWVDEEKKVSIICLAYNHGSYITQALDGMLDQKTSFPFEIIVHEDASTDNTADIIKKYHIAYPEIIKPIFQIENQYSKTPNSGNLFICEILPRCYGKYIAFCEGDDYWINDTKLALQVRALELNPNFNLCFHPNLNRYEGAEIKESVDCLYAKEMTVIPPEQVIYGGGGFMSTASLMIRKTVFNNELISYRKQFTDVGDYCYQVFASLPNGALYIPLLGSVYRRNVAGSWVSRTLSNPVLYVRHHLEMTKFHLFLADKLPQYKAIIYKKVKENTSSLCKNLDKML